jgi:hypothetical protein
MPDVASKTKYPLPAFLKDRCTPSVYKKWLDNKADTLLKRDRKRGRPYAAAATDAFYKQLIHRAIMEAGEFDPFTGDRLAWELISTWDTSPAHAPEPGYRKKFALMPTVDHIDPELCAFEICALQTNACKSDLDPAEFVAFCRRVAGFKKTKGYIMKWLSLKKEDERTRAVC